ncbi:MAG: SRPBCC family protein [Phormidesmis sp.]
MPSRFFAKHVRSWGKAAALAIALATPIATASAQTPEPADASAEQPVAAESVQTVFAELSEQDQATLSAGQVTVDAKRAGDKGQFIARVLIEAPTETAWDVLTDYDNFEQFLPNVEDSELLESNGDEQVFQQMNVISVVPGVLDIRSQVKISSVESSPERVDFNLVEGDLKLLQGVWSLVPVTGEDGSETDKVLITHQVDIDPGESSPRGLFFSTYRLVLEDSLVAAKAETERRAAQ